MTERQWLESADPALLLRFLYGRASDRKLRLFACACCRRIWQVIASESSPQEIEVGERYADGLSDSRELREFRSQLGARGGYSSGWAANTALHAVLNVNAFRSADAAVSSLGNFFDYLLREEKSDELEGDDLHEAANTSIIECEKLVFVFRDLFGNPFRPISLDPSWLAWSAGRIGQLAQTAYEDRHLPEGTLDPDRLAVLADALEDAGGTDAAILEHLRGPGPHVRGCFVLDLFLGKE